MNRIAIAGGTGFLGNALEKFFAAKGNEVQILTRNPRAANHVKWDALNRGDWEQCLEGCDVLINLAGKSVDCRYNARNKEEILRSRVDSTLVLHEAIAQLSEPPRVWVNSSSATIYAHAETELRTERDGVIGDDFSMGVCKAWEAAFFGETVGLEAGHSFSYKPARPRASEAIRMVAARTAIVIGGSGEAFRTLKRLCQFGLGGRHGRGTQRFSWVHIDDFCRAIDHIIEKPSLTGPVNIAAPQPVSNDAFMRKLRQAVGVPFGLNHSRAALEIGAVLLKTETELLLKSRNIYPEKLLTANFHFDYQDLDTAFAALLN